MLCTLQFVDVNPELDFKFGMDGSTFASEPAKVVFFISDFFLFQNGVKGTKSVILNNPPCHCKLTRRRRSISIDIAVTAL